MKDKMIVFFENDESFDYDLNEYKNKYHNDRLGVLVLNLTVQDRVIEYDNRILQQFNSNYHEPEKAKYFGL